MIYRKNISNDKFDGIQLNKNTFDIWINNRKGKYIEIGDYILYTNINDSSKEIICEVTNKIILTCYDDLISYIERNSIKIDINEYSKEEIDELGIVILRIKNIYWYPEEFKFLDFNFLTDQVIDLRVHQKVLGIKDKLYVPAYKYHIYLHNTEILIGYIDIRIGNTPGLLYGGHIGYTILEDFRGHKYAQRACELIFNVGLQHGLNKLFITCAPNNIPSRKTLENLGLKLIGILDLPKHNEMYIEGKRIVCVFEYINI